MTTTPRWFTDHPSDHSQAYVRRFRRLAADGADLAGEARFVDALLAPHSRVLDAGCGPGRVGAELFARGHRVVGVDVDPVLVAAAREDHPGPRWLVADLAELSPADLADTDESDESTSDESGAPLPAGSARFDAAVLSGNVMVFLAPGTEQRVLERLAACVRPDGAIVTGFATGRPYTVADLDRDAQAAGLVVEHRFATWDLRPWHDGADWAVTVLRVPRA